MTANYDNGFYRDRHARTAHAADTVIGQLLRRLPPVAAAVDIGCGVGTWLAALQQRGVGRIAGFDGPWVDKSHLVIPVEVFSPIDLRAELRERIAEAPRYDLAVSLEVAEHLPASDAPAFVAALTAAADFVLFSAAIPGQGGRGHVNEQWQTYWAELFEAQNFVAVDCVRPGIWDDDSIAVWYRQNTLLYVAAARRSEVDYLESSPAALPLAVVHPALFSARNGKRQTLGRRVRRLLRSRLRAPWRRLRDAVSRH